MADDVSSNILEWSAEFRELMEGFDLTIPGKDQSLGRDLAGLAAQGIIDRSINEQTDANFQSWRQLERTYKARKLKKFGVDLIGVRSGQMLSLESVMGDTEVSANDVTMRYGTGTAPTSSSSGGELDDDEPTDTQKAEWFTEGGREFYEIDSVDAEAIYDEVAKALEDYLTGA